MSKFELNAAQPVRQLRWFEDLLQLEVLLAFLGVIAGIGFMMWQWQKVQLIPPGRWETLGLKGDFFGGFLSGITGLATVFLVYAAFKAQRLQMREDREEAAETIGRLEAQLKIQKLQAKETLLFKLLESLIGADESMQFRVLSVAQGVRTEVTQGFSTAIRAFRMAHGNIQGVPRRFENTFGLANMRRLRVFLKTVDHVLALIQRGEGLERDIWHLLIIQHLPADFVNNLGDTDFFGVDEFRQLTFLKEFVRENAMEKTPDTQP